MDETAKIPKLQGTENWNIMGISGKIILNYHELWEIVSEDRKPVYVITINSAYYLKTEHIV